MLTATQVAALKSELQTDPRGYGYNAAARNDTDMASRVNAVRDGTNPPTNPSVNLGTGGLGEQSNGSIYVRQMNVTGGSIFAVTVVADYTALGSNPTATALSQERRYLSWYTGLAAMPTGPLLNADGSDTPVMTNLRAMFGAGTGSLASVLALAKRFGSRAEELFGPTAAVTTDDIAAALN